VAEAVRVLIVDDQPPFRAAARLVLDVLDGFEVVGEAGSGEEALERAGELAPELVVMDINLPGIDGIEATRRLQAERPEAAVVLVSTYRGDELPDGAETCGAMAYVHKERLDPDLLEGLWAGRDTGVWRTA
jgi:two-component system, NarL family, invasion response regulator UvrY